MRRTLLILLLAAAALVAVLVSALNAGRVELELAFGRVVVPLGFSLVAVFTLGLLCGLATRGLWVTQLLNERGRLRRALRRAEAAARSSAIAGQKSN